MAAALRDASGGRSEVRVSDGADLVVVGCDPSEVSPHDLRKIPVIVMALGGRLTHLRDG
jgi:hypothetical protein